MILARICSAVAFLLVVISVAFKGEFSGAAPSNNYRWSERGIFVFGSILLDFDRSVARQGIDSSRLRNCSTFQFYCAESDIVRLVLPRSCLPKDAFSPGVVFRVGSVTSAVISVIQDHSDLQRIHPTNSGVVVLIGDISRPGTIYEFDPSYGVIAIYRDLIGNKSLFDAARGATDMNWFEKTGLDSDVYKNELVTLDPFGSCQKSR